jgi:hypothetical protein
VNAGAPAVSGRSELPPGRALLRTNREIAACVTVIRRRSLSLRPCRAPDHAEPLQPTPTGRWLDWRIARVAVGDRVQAATYRDINCDGLVCNLKISS